MEKEKPLEKFFDDVLKTVKDGLDKLVDKTDQLTTIGRIKLDIMSVKRDIEKKFTDLGGRVYQLAVEQNEKEVLADGEVQNHFEKIKELQRRLTEKEKELEKAKQEAPEEAAAEEAAEAEAAETKS